MIETKFCTRGDHEVEAALFSKSSRTSDGLFSWCKPCMAAYERARYLAGDKLRKARNKLKIRTRNRDFIWKYLTEHPCSCGNSDPRVLQFDHLDPSTKLYNVSEMIDNYSIALIEAEIAKCEVLCAHCHIIRTNSQFGYWKVDRTDELTSI